MKRNRMISRLAGIGGMLGIMALTLTGYALEDNTAPPVNVPYIFGNFRWDSSVDQDGDGYTAERILYVDVDSTLPSEDVYFMYYYRPTGGAWIYAGWSGDYTVNATTYTDEKFVTFGVNPEYAHGAYDIAVDLYTWDGTLIESRDDSTDSFLGSQLFETAAQDTPSAITYAIWNCWWDTTYNVDQDGDGYTRQRYLIVDADTSASSAPVYLRIYHRLNGANTWSFDFETDSFTITGSSGGDSRGYSIGTDPAYNQGTYDLKVELYTEAGALVATRNYNGDTDLDNLNFETASQDTPVVVQTCQFCLDDSAYVAEEGNKLNVWVNRMNGSSGSASVNYVMKPKRAAPWLDYVPRTGTLTWQNGDTSPKLIKIDILEDGEAEGNEVFKITLKNPVGGTLMAPRKGKILIAGNDKAGAVATDATVERMTKLTGALDGDALTWFTSAAAPWTRQTFATADGEDAAISGPSAGDGSSWLQTDVEGPGKLKFDWLVEGMGSDACLLIVDGQAYRTLSPGYIWSRETISLGEGWHTLQWVFSGESLGTGAAYLDQVKWKPVNAED